MLRTEAQSNDAGGQASQHRPPLQQSKEHWHRQWLRTGQNPANHSFLHHDLQPLRRPSRKFPAPLDRVNVTVLEIARSQLPCQGIRGCHGILNRQIDSNPSDRGHRVRRIANTQKPGPTPLPQAIHFYGQQTYVTPIAQFADSVSQEGLHIRDFFAERLYSSLADLLCCALWNHKAALPILVAVDHDKHFASLRVTEGLARIAAAPAESHPQDIHGRAYIHHL
jgi:hypothetical protein